MSIKDLPFVTVEQVVALREAAIELEAQLADADLRLGDPRDVPIDTGNPEVDRVLLGLGAADVEFSTCVDAAVLLRRLAADHDAPDGFTTWRDAAVHTRAQLAEAQRDAERYNTAIGDALDFLKMVCLHTEDPHALHFVNMGMSHLIGSLPSGAAVGQARGDG